MSQLIVEEVYETLQGAPWLFCQGCRLKASGGASEVLSIGFVTEDAEVIYCSICHKQLSIEITYGEDDRHERIVSDEVLEFIITRHEPKSEALREALAGVNLWQCPDCGYVQSFGSQCPYSCST